MGQPVDNPSNPQEPATAPNRDADARSRSQQEPSAQALLQAQIRRDLQGLGLGGEGLDALTQMCLEEALAPLPYPAQPACPIENLPRPETTGRPANRGGNGRNQ